MSLIKSLTFFGSARTREENSVFQDAYETAAKLAEHKLTVVNGGGPGEMLAATFGAKSAGGKVKVVYYTPQHATTFEGKNKLNAGDEEFEESNYILRTKKLLELGDAYVIFRGGSGTISEFGMAWGLAKLYFGHHKPLILFGNFWEHIIRAFKDNMLMRPEELKVYRIVNTPDGVLKAILEFEEELTKGEHQHIKPSQENGYTV